MTFKWTSPSTWTAGATLTAAQLNTQVRDNLSALNGHVVKSADESVTSSTTLQNDNDLLWTIPQAGTYVAEVTLFVTSAANAAGDINVGWSFPTGTLHFGIQGNDVTLASSVSGTWSAGSILSATSGTSVHGLGASTSVVLIRVHAILIATASGTLQFMWCQNSSNANATTVKAGSHMLIRQTA